MLLRSDREGWLPVAGSRSAILSRDKKCENAFRKEDSYPSLVPTARTDGSYTSSAMRLKSSEEKLKRLSLMEMPTMPTLSPDSNGVLAL